MNEGPRLSSVGWMHACISLSPWLWRTQTWPSHEARLISEDTVPPVPEAPTSVRPSTHTAASPVIRSQPGTPGGTARPIVSSQKPVYNAPNWQSPPKSADLPHTQTRSRETIVPDIWVNCLSSKAVAKFLWHPCLCWCDRPVLAAPVSVFANYAAWCPQIMIRNAKSFSKKHMQYWTVKLLGTLYSKSQQLGWLPFQSVPMLYYQDWPAFIFQLVR